MPNFRANLFENDTYKYKQISLDVMNNFQRLCLKLLDKVIVRLSILYFEFEDFIM